MTLRWEGRGEHQTAFSGQLAVGSIGRRSDGSCWYHVTAVDLRYISRALNLHVGNIRTAKRAVERAWAAWLSRAELGPGGAARNAAGTEAVKDGVKDA
ncbi:MAG TPA: hypothetical protein VL358_04840 [Caulobacteraceae bacterium]|jgi:hypothetical protein|nr:hypothetical protein [Caulobacteraceae bacterium]